MIILKIGGSILTEKDSNEPEVDYESLNRISEEIRESFYADEISSDLVDGLIIVHGAGSFGHPPAKKYAIGEPFEMKDYLSKRIGFCEIQNEVKRLNSIICASLLEKGIPAIAIPPSSFITSHNKRIDTCNLEIIKKYLHEGYVPVLFGDVVLDSELKFAVISGDQILQYIAKFLKSDRIVLGTDVDGVYTKNPKTNDDAVHIDRVSSIEDIKSLESTTNVDVTGGMVGKVKELLELAEYNISSEIIDANEEGAVSKALQGEEVRGTKISKF
ncbi:isopentenyl phosphate kinase [uncultured Methanobrevibacter sp.]|uniref:isopentenyl phosphate kinase n=1 Tax=uncultured Methanobrevibacter sp. TaxID=253161 RepID=UPI0026113D82